MKKILVIQSSLNSSNGNSYKLAEKYINELTKTMSVDVSTRNLADSELPHLNDAEMSAWMTPEEARSSEQQALAQISDEIVLEVERADEIVLAVPMYNFGIPSSLKAWFDRLARAGRTFKYTENGPVGLLKDKKVTVLAARGGIYAGTPLDTQTEYLKHFWQFLGVNDVNFVYAEGLAMGEEAANEAWKSAEKNIFELIGA
ncbi:FMN-dependent NADH-azoreductase [Alteromonas facilis]|uniref:FMN-dependent NADH-azoreductase n=1 Tax=Alteromonas facilis TaxID=2048004 RepID=UPI000C292AE3|nr:NAD(P)H-dependent oxidoreductase [Alteromonas facilis]